MRVPERLFDGYVFDLDGVVYLTNKPLEMPADYAAKLTRLPRRPSLLQTDRTT